MTDRQLFIIGHDALAAVSDEEVVATVAGLKEVGLYHLPYDRVAVRFLTDDCVLPYNPDVASIGLDRRFNFWQADDGRWHSKMGPAHYIEFRNINLRGEPASMWCVHDGSDTGWRPYEFNADNKTGASSLDDMSERTADILITLLATRNAVKETVEHKTAKLGIGGKQPGSTRRYQYVTTIGVPKELEDDVEHKPTGATRAAHLRRGHIRRQHYGPGNQFVKTKWIAPVFVNADPSFVNTRAAYNVSLRKVKEPA